MRKKITDKDYELPARFTDIVVFEKTPITPLPKWKQDILDKINSAETAEEANKLSELLYGPPDEDMKRVMELFEN